MSYTLEFSENAKKDIDSHRKSGNVTLLKKSKKLLLELTKHPYEGTGKPEPLKHELQGMWSRRINKEHRLVYEIKGSIIYIHSMKGHY